VQDLHLTKNIIHRCGDGTGPVWVVLEVVYSYATGVHMGVNYGDVDKNIAWLDTWLVC